MKFRLIDIDLDGTALLPDRIRFSQRLLEALEKAHQSGVHILPATGRQYSMLPPVFREDISWKEYTILCNGAEIRDLRNGTILSSYYIDPRQAIAVLETAKEYKAPMEIAAEGKMILTRDSYEWLKQNGGQAMDYHLNYTLPRFGQFVEDLESYIIQEKPVIEKVFCAFLPVPDRPAIYKRLSQFQLSCVWGSANGIELTHPQATKKNGLLKVCSLLNIDPQECIAFGDSGNDISVLETAGLGIAVENAPQDVKECADYVTDTNKMDGVAKALEKFVLNVNC